jgi:hypothetical protein
VQASYANHTEKAETAAFSGQLDKIASNMQPCMYACDEYMKNAFGYSLAECHSHNDILPGEASYV